MTPIYKLVRAWLCADPAVTALVSDRIGPTVYREDALPAVLIGPTNGAAESIASAPVDVVETWRVALYCLADRLEGNDEPDTETAGKVASAVVEAARRIARERYVHPEYGSIVRARVTSAVPGRDPDTGRGRVSVTLELRTWA